MQEGHDGEEEQQLYAKLDELADHHADGGNEPGEIHLAKNTGIRDKRIAGTGEAGGEIIPDDDARHLESHAVYAIGANARHHVEEQHTYRRGKRRLNEMPERPEDGLLVLRGKIPLYEQHHEVAVTPEIF